MRVNKITAIVIVSLFLISNLTILSIEEKQEREKNDLISPLGLPSVLEEIFSTKGFSDQITELGQWDESYDSAEQIEIVDDLLYLASDENGLTIFNISDITSPVFIDSFECRLPVDDVAVKDDFAYLAVGVDGIITVNVSDPENMLKICSKQRRMMIQRALSMTLIFKGIISILRIGMEVLK